LEVRNTNLFRNYSNLLLHRGPIWLNINYLALSALRHYSQIDTCQEKDRANLMYHQLRDNIINNVVGEYHRTGYYWEHYNDQTGRGMRGHPFAGWTSIIVNIMAELY
jgi:mannosyl-oligosaccharide glucosidase